MRWLLAVLALTSSSSLADEACLPGCPEPLSCQAGACIDLRAESEQRERWLSVANRPVQEAADAVSFRNGVHFGFAIESGAWTGKAGTIDFDFTEKVMAALTYGVDRFELRAHLGLHWNLISSLRGWGPLAKLGASVRVLDRFRVAIAGTIGGIFDFPFNRPVPMLGVEVAPTLAFGARRNLELALVVEYVGVPMWRFVRPDLTVENCLANTSGGWGCMVIQPTGYTSFSLRGSFLFL